MSKPIIAPSLLSADFSEMGNALKTIEASGAQWVHLDIMDSRFVPNLTFGPKMVSDLKKRTSLFFDAHLMTVEPESLVDSFIEAGADAITFHLEASVHSHRLLQRIRLAGKKAGISIVPSTPASHLSELLGSLDMILVMSVNPGFGGQSLIPSCLEKLRFLAEERKRLKLDFLLAVDGGINMQTYQAALEAGADVLVMGNAFFGSDDKKALVQKIHS